MSILTPDTVLSCTDVDEAFGGGYRFLPPVNDIDDSYHSRDNPFHRLACDLMYNGVPGDNIPKMTLKEAYEPVASEIPKFMRSILGSFQPKHEHKIAGAAMLLSEMFELDT